MVKMTNTWNGSLLEEENATPIETTEPTNNNAEAWVFTVNGVNDQITRDIPEPEKIVQEEQAPEIKIEPKIESVVDVAPEQAKIEPVKANIVTDTVKTEDTTPVLTTQEIESNELANKVTEDNIKTEENKKTLASFQAALTSWNKGDLLKISQANPALRDNFNSMIRWELSTISNIRYVGKYSSFTNDQLSAAVKSWDIVVGSERYNKLPESQRNSFAQYQAQEQAIITSEQQQNQFLVDTNQTISFDNILTQLKGIFSTDLRKGYDEVMNSEEITSTAKDLEGKQNAINELNATIDWIKEDVQKEYSHLPRSSQAAIIADRTNKLNKSKNALVNEYNSKLGTYQSLKDDAQLEMDFLKYEDAQNKEIYNTALEMYQTERARMDKWELLKFEQESKIKAEERALLNTKELYKYQQELKELWWEWEGRFDWLYFLKNDWTAEKVIEWGMKINSDWTSTYTYVDSKWRPIVQNYDVNGNVIWASAENFTQYQTDLLNAPNWAVLPSRLKATTNPNWWKECAEYVNDIFKVWMWNTYASKLKVANETTWSLWAIAVWQPNPNNKEFAQYWHTWVIVWESTDWKSWHIKSSNFKWDGKISFVIH